MDILNKKIELSTKGATDLVNITDQISAILAASKLKKGILTAFIVGSTAALTTFEYEPGMIKDIKDFFNKLIPANKHYAHDETWGDANGFSHLRASLQGPSLTIPFNKSRLSLGTWQQIVLAEFDNRPRERQVIIQLIGE
ncbi:secondary thiamine-phosphate synthase enzyme YjbQ [Planctomycetota bacterium]